MSDFIDMLKKQGDQLFDKRSPLLALWQEIAENFYPERADFTTDRSITAGMADNLTTSYPIIARRDLGNAFSAMLRPSQKPWFNVRSQRPDKDTTLGKQWLEWLTGFDRNLMYDNRSQFIRATKEGDHDFATFGQCVISTEMNPTRSGLLFRCWHLRDVVWVEDATGAIGTIHRTWDPTAQDLMDLFPKTCSQKVKDAATKDPFRTFKVRHVVMATEHAQRYDASERVQGIRQPYVSVYFEHATGEVLELVGAWTQHYTIARWQTVSGSQYAHSPAVVAALPDARLLQQITAVLLEAGEKAVTPPMIGVQEALRGDVSVYAGGITWVDAAYDERLGEVLRPVTQDKSGIQFGLEIQRDVRAQLAEAFYLSKLNLPPVDGTQMTAYEVGQRVQEFIRNTLPLFEPMEANYNGVLCDHVTTLAIHNTPEVMQSIPEELRGQSLDYTFESPLREAIEKIKVGQYMEANQVLSVAIQADPTVALLVDNKKATRDVLGAVIPAAWIRSEGDVEKAAAQQQQQVQAQQLLGMMQQGADVAKTINEATPTAGVGGAAL